MEDLLAKVERDMALAVREPEGDQPWGDSFQEMEELFTQVEHHTALAQIALDDIQMKLASIRSDAEPIPSHDAIPDSAVPGNVIRFRTR